MTTIETNLCIYNEIVKHYKAQMTLNIIENKRLFEADFYKIEKTNALLKKNYLEIENKIIISVGGFTCSFKDAFAIKVKFDKLLKPKERYYMFKKPLPIDLHKETLLQLAA